MIRTTFAQAFALVAACWLAAPTQAQAAGPYDAYDALLKKYVDARGMVDYAAFKRNDEAALRACVQSFAAMDPSGFSKAEKLAYWINVYNAVTLQGILEFFPLKSIKDKAGKDYNIWDHYVFGPKRLSLNAIENEILRKMDEPRIHAAIVCASRGCPILRNEAYLPARLDAQLDDNCRSWFRDRARGLSFQGTTARVSKVFEWFGGDFPAGDAGKLGWIARFVEPEVAAKLRAKSTRLGYLEWDWALNAQ